MDETLVSNSIKRRLSMQNEVLKWLKEFSDKMQHRANDATAEIHGLLDQARIVELDLKNTFNSFHSLSYNRFIDHRISDEDVVGCYTKESPESSVEAGIPAQNYETDILPRYKEALLLGLTSCRNHLETTKRNHFTSSVFSTGSAHGLLPHIIGSEEYIHDNSCGLTEDFALGTVARDLSCIMEPNEVSPDAVEHDSPDLFGPQMFGMQQGSPKKDGIEPLVSAASDFKAMLEAALVNTYKFYDEESLLADDAVSGNMSAEQIHKNVDLTTSRASDAGLAGSSQHLNVTEKNIMPLTEGNLTSLQDPDIHAHELYSVLVSGSLFDTEEDSLSSNQKKPVNIPASVAESISEHADIVDDHVIETTGITYHHIKKNVDADTSLSSNEEEGRLKAPFEDDASEMEIASEGLASSPCKLEGDASSSLIDSSVEIGADKELCNSDLPATESSEGILSVSDPATMQDGEGLNSSSQSGEGHSPMPAEEPCSRSDSDDEGQ